MADIELELSADAALVRCPRRSSPVAAALAAARLIVLALCVLTTPYCRVGDVPMYYATGDVESYSITRGSGATDGDGGRCDSEDQAVPRRLYAKL
jgi:hypothetical protein